MHRAAIDRDDPGPTLGAILASLRFAGCGLAAWPWTWSDDEREHHAHAAIWAQVRPTAEQDVPWTRSAAWADANEDHVELVLIRRAGSADTAPSPFTCCDPHPLPGAVSSITEGREPDAQVAHGEAVQVPGAATRDLLGLGSEKPGELPLEAQPRVLLDDALADCIGYLVAA